MRAHISTTGVIACRPSCRFGGGVWTHTPRKLIDLWARETESEVRCDQCGRPLDRRSRERALRAIAA